MLFASLVDGRHELSITVDCNFSLKAATLAPAVLGGDGEVSSSTLFLKPNATATGKGFELRPVAICTLDKQMPKIELNHTFTKLDSPIVFVSDGSCPILLSAVVKEGKKVVESKVRPRDKSQEKQNAEKIGFAKKLTPYGTEVQQNTVVKKKRKGSDADASTKKKQKKGVTKEKAIGGGVAIQNIALGSGKDVRTGGRVTIVYSSRVADTDETLDSSKKIQFRVGLGEVPTELENGMEGMKVGGKRRITTSVKTNGSRLTIPTCDGVRLVFEVELLQAK